MNIAAVVVSYNRSALLEDVLRGIAKQTRLVDHLIVVDNASTDDSVRVVNRDAPNAELIALRENTGGAGGFAVGIASALRAKADWIWVMDDDTVPEPGALQALVEVAEGQDDEQLVLLGSRAVWKDGSDHPMNTPRQRLFAPRSDRAAAAQGQCMPVRSLSFVSAMLRATRVAEVGLPISDYFLWNDDFEFTSRLARNRRALFVPTSVVEHRTMKKGSSDDDPGERFFFEVRNKIWLMRYSQCFSAAEKLLYSLATLRRWIRTRRNSQNRAVLGDAFRRGWDAGWKQKPRPNSVVLREALADQSLKDSIGTLT